MGERVEIPVYYDDWMRGDRYGEITDYSRRNPSYVWVKLDKSGKRVRCALSALRYLD